MHRVKAAQCQQAQPLRIHFRASIQMGVQATALRNLIERSRGLYTGVLTHLPCLAGRMPGGHTRATGLDVRQSWARMNLGGQYLVVFKVGPRSIRDWQTCNISIASIDAMSDYSSGQKERSTSRSLLLTTVAT